MFAPPLADEQFEEAVTVPSSPETAGGGWSARSRERARARAQERSEAPWEVTDDNWQPTDASDETTPLVFSRAPQTQSETVSPVAAASDPEGDRVDHRDELVTAGAGHPTETAPPVRRGRERPLQSPWR